MKITIGKFEITNTSFGVYYEHAIHGDEKAGGVYIDENKNIYDLDGDTDIPLSVLSVLTAKNIISVKSFKEQMTHRYSIIEE